MGAARPKTYFKASLFFYKRSAVNIQASHAFSILELLPEADTRMNGRLPGVVLPLYLWIIVAYRVSMFFVSIQVLHTLSTTALLYISSEKMNGLHQYITFVKV